jgi:hypothetical protein
LLATYVGSQSSGPWAPRVSVWSGADGTFRNSVICPNNQYETTFGAAIAGIGDFDGDGRPDFAVGAPGYQSGNGAVFVFSGRNFSLLATIPGNTGANFGASIAPLGDVDGDGRPDFAVGAPTEIHNGASLGAVHVIGFRISPDVTMSPSACSNATSAPVLTPSSMLPWPGGVVRFLGFPAPGTVAATWMVGLSDLVGGQPLPVDLSPFGIPGCQLYAAPEAQVPLSSNPGSLQINLPNAGWVPGLLLRVQIAAFVPSLPTGLSFSSGMRVQCGHRP